jgi:hypothetical protein
VSAAGPITRSARTLRRRARVCSSSAPKRTPTEHSAATPPSRSARETRTACPASFSAFPPASSRGISIRIALFAATDERTSSRQPRGERSTSVPARDQRPLRQRTGCPQATRGARRVSLPRKSARCNRTRSAAGCTGSRMTKSKPAFCIKLRCVFESPVTNAIQVGRAGEGAMVRSRRSACAMRAVVTRRREGSGIEPIEKSRALARTQSAPRSSRRRRTASSSPSSSRSTGDAELMTPSVKAFQSDRERPRGA